MADSVHYMATNDYLASDLTLAMFLHFVLCVRMDNMDEPLDIGGIGGLLSLQDFITGPERVAMYKTHRSKVTDLCSTT